MMKPKPYEAAIQINSEFDLSKALIKLNTRQLNALYLSIQVILKDATFNRADHLIEFHFQYLFI